MFKSLIFMGLIFLYKVRYRIHIVSYDLKPTRVLKEGQ